MEKINFKPLTKGLGFQTFSNGLPYAPAKKSKKELKEQLKKEVSKNYDSGAGATAAGPVINVIPPPPPKAQPLDILTKTAVEQTVATKEQETKSDLKQDIQEFGLVYLLKRFLAFTFDTVFHAGLCALSFGYVGWKLGFTATDLIQPDILFVCSLFLFIFNWALITAQEIAFETTLGKRFFGIKVEGPATAIFLRAFFFIVSVSFFGLGILWSLFDKQKRCWHDIFVNLQPKEVVHY